MESKFELTTTKSGDLIAEEIEDGIYVIKNALTVEEVTYLRDIAESTTEDGWKANYLRELRLQGVSVYGEDDTENVEAYVQRNINEYWIDKTITIPDSDLCANIVNRIKPFFEGKYDLQALSEIQRQYEGQGLDEHYDGGYDERILRAIIFYVNDDFTGGQLYFPDRKFEYSPTAGDFITFPASKDYVHGVRLVGVGPGRYAMAGFAWEHGALDEWIKDH